MKTKLLSLFTLVLFLSLGIYYWWFYQPRLEVKPQKPEEKAEVFLEQRTFAELPGWEKAKVSKSLFAFQLSCKTFLRQDPEEAVGSEQIQLKAKDWQPACREALSIQPVSEDLARLFFQKWFTPIEFSDKKPVQGLFTGYYMAYLHGSLTKTKEYNVPIYGLPSNLISINLELFDPKQKNQRYIGRIEGNQMIPYYTRAEINSGAIIRNAPILAWVNSHVDRLFLEIQGSGTIELADGKRMYVNYAGQNGAPYTAIAKVLINQGIMTKDNASMQRIKRYLEENPEKMHQVLNQNKSFVFFRPLKKEIALGALGVALTPGYSLAVDKKWIPLGAPLWLHTTRPAANAPEQAKIMQRLMIAQDTGGAIRGLVRGDVYWGADENATTIAGHMKNPGHYWLLLPRHTVTWLKRELKSL